MMFSAIYVKKGSDFRYPFFFGVPNGTLLELPKTYPADNLREITSLPDEIYITWPAGCQENQRQ
jgi:hypothetical protein